jgi:hypothetical protein
MNTAEKIRKYERLNEITDELNSLFQDSFVEEIKSGEADSPSNLIYEAMQLIDREACLLEEEICTENDVDSIYDLNERL